MKTPVAALIIGFFVAVWLTPLARDFALRANLVDDPKEGRRVNKVPIPRIGGIAMAIAVLAPIAGLAVYENEISALIYADARGAVTLLLGAIAALAVGLADDLFDTSAKLRLALLLGIAWFAWMGGHRIDVLDVPGYGIVDLGLLSAPVTMLWIAGVMVAFNFIDGLDGLAAGIALIASLTMFALAYLEANVLWMTWTGAMVGALLGFLVFNFNPASIFMGDSGSNFLGFLMGVVALGTSRKETTAVAIFLPMVLVGLPLLDLSLTILRRAFLREGLFMSERGHLHHRLLDLGLSHRRAVLALWGTATTLCVAGLVMVVGVPGSQIIAISLLTAVVFTLIFKTGYVRPDDLMSMWQRGKDNQARMSALAELSTDIAREAPAAAARTGRLAIALERLTNESGISGAVYVRDGQEMVVGDYEQDAKGVRATLPLVVAENGPADDGAEVVFLWKGRTSGPTKREVETLRGLLADLSEKV